MDELVKQAIKRELVRKPSKGFTDRVMGQVFKLKEIPVYKPLISKGVWVFIGVLFVLFVFGLFLIQPENSTEVTQLAFIDKIKQDFETVEFRKFDYLENINFLLIAIVSFVVFLLLFFDTLFFKKR
ncbi:MAG: hypothetical protein PF541_05415 [Prolixibacteraceae bacterium]|jgi:hypothetical protein|nr:hypothetical protein [Prolixibacteraceae bacterium]